MINTLQTLFRICLLKANPQDLPSTQQTLLGSIVFAAVISLIIDNLVFKNLNILLLVGVQIILIAASWGLLLKITNKMDRWMQSASAIFGTGAIINLLSLPLFLNTDQFTRDGGGEPGMAAFAITAVIIWDIAVTARIIRETLEVRTIIAVSISLAMRYLFIVVIGGLFSLSG